MLKFSQNDALDVDLGIAFTISKHNNHQTNINIIVLSVVEELGGPGATGTFSFKIQRVLVKKELFPASC